MKIYYKYHPITGTQEKAIPFNMESLNHIVKIVECRKIPQQIYLAKANFCIFCENPVFLSNRAVIIPSRMGYEYHLVSPWPGWTERQDLHEKYGAVQLHFGKVVLLCPKSALTWKPNFKLDLPCMHLTEVKTSLTHQTFVMLSQIISSSK